MSNNAEDLQAIAARVKARGAELQGAHTLEELKELWRRLPNVNGNPPKGVKALAERVALYLTDMGDEAPKDLKVFIEGTEPVRPFGPPQEAVPVANGDGEGAESPAVAGDSPPQTDEDESMHTQTNTGAKKRAGAANRAASAKTTTRKKKATAAKKEDGPRKGTIQAMVIELTLDGKTPEQIAKAVTKAFPKMKFAKMDEATQKGHVGWYRNNARKKGWLPKVN